MSTEELQRISLAFGCGLACGITAIRMKDAASSYFRRFKVVEDIPLDYFKGRSLQGTVLSVTDGDTFRMLHKPPFLSASKGEGKVSENSLQLRLAGIDTPETAKFGKDGQPFGEEAKTFLKSRIEGRTLRVKLLHRDQYMRGVVIAERVSPFWPLRKCLSEEMLSAGLAYVYRQQGAVYGGKQAFFEKLEAQAQREGRGVWSLGDAAETPAEYKAKHA
ncbi:hypothetical protein CYMTET_25575 [Cymbomonas tetramitiformis]|uniref:TNase-like domain-containing protein n=1 Tax=Cymbomonas tetramitiformis TaxID=36881 RepID=A0AAE0FU56_9CHLO|nr:hypothetical protein CYMTET_25575 [Cymbomonas tetramitiformis]|eukprot:gene15571-18458_t